MYWPNGKVSSEAKSGAIISKLDLKLCFLHSIRKSKKTKNLNFPKGRKTRIKQKKEKGKMGLMIKVKKMYYSMLEK